MMRHLSVRGWMLIAQLSVAAGLVGLAFGAPAESLGWRVAFAFLTAFAAASQDVTIDGWRIDAAPIERQGMMSAVYQRGYRLAMLCAGAGTLYIADFASWRDAYLAMAGMTLIGIGGCLLSPRLDKPAEARGRRFASFAVSFVEPLRDLLNRYGHGADRNPRAACDLSPAGFRFRRDGQPPPYRPRLHQIRHRHRLKTPRRVDWHCGRVRRRRSGGAAGVMPSLIVGGVAASLSHLTLALLAAHGASLPLLTLSVSAESFASGFAGAALIAYMSSLVSPAFAASQYALLSSLYALPGKLIGGLSGLMVDEFGYVDFFVASAAIGIPVVALSLTVWRVQGREAEGAPARV
jgi:PAT family beta-lactamase induction signal transducer AmpG